MKFRDFLPAWGPVIAWMALMFFGSTDLMSAEHTSRFLTPFLRWLDPDISPATIAQAHLLVRKAAHVIEYTILTALLFRALRGLIAVFWWRAAVALIPALMFAAADEYHQSLVPSRTGAVGDVLIDYCGAIAGIIICR
ncbi:MAG: VanZ family protein, partial [Spartobacteria bacterium]